MAVHWHKPKSGEPKRKIERVDCLPVRFRKPAAEQAVAPKTEATAQA